MFIVSQCWSLIILPVNSIFQLDDRERERERTIYIFNTNNMRVFVLPHKHTENSMWVVSCCAFQFLFNIFTKQSQFISNEYQNENSGCFFSIFSLFSRPGCIVCSFSYPFIVIFALVDVRAPRNVGGRFGFLVCFIVFVLVLVLVLVLFIVILVVLNCTMKTCMQSLHFKLVPFVSYVFGCVHAFQLVTR